MAYHRNMSVIEETYHVVREINLLNEDIFALENTMENARKDTVRDRQIKKV